MTDLTIVDRAIYDRLVDSVGGDQEFLSDLLQTYFDDSPKQLAAMQAALPASNASALRTAAHSLKSNSATLGAMALSRICKELEEMGKAGALEGAPERIAQAAAEYNRVQTALQTLAG